MSRIEEREYWVPEHVREVRIRHYDAGMVIPLTWDEKGVSECAFVTPVFYRGKAIDQLQMHVRVIDLSSSSCNGRWVCPQGKAGPSWFSMVGAGGQLGLEIPSDLRYILV